MEVAYEENFSVCQEKCLNCDSQYRIRYSNYNFFHKVCQECVVRLSSIEENRNLPGSRVKCIHCESLVKVVFSIETSDVNSSNVYMNPSTLSSKNSKSSTKKHQGPGLPSGVPLLAQFNEESKATFNGSKNFTNLKPTGRGKGILSENTLTNPKTRLNPSSAIKVTRTELKKLFECDHHYCEKCANKREVCLVCKKQLDQVLCSVCNRQVTLTKRGDFWQCSYCSLLSLECIACETFGSTLNLNEKCSTCNCPKSIDSDCRNHSFCQKCFFKMGNKCGVCSQNQYTCRSCDTIDIMCVKSFCPYCCHKTKNFYCVTCGQQ